MNSLKTLALSVAMALFAISAPLAEAASTDPAAAKIESFYATLLDAMKRGPQLGTRGRYQLLAPVVDSTFDIPTMVRFVVGPGWAQMPASDQKALIESFRRMTIANWASNFDSYDGQRFDVEPTTQVKAGDRFVQSTLVPRSDKPIPFIFRMRQVGNDWKAIDIYLNGYVDEMTTRRSDFASTLQTGGAPALVRKLNAMADSSLAGTKTTMDSPT